MDKKFLWHPYTQMRDWLSSDNVVISKGSGFHIIDTQGRRYLDGTSSMWCNVWGHGRNPVARAMREQIGKIQHSTLFGLSNEPATLLAEKLVKITKRLDRVFYTDNGSTAIEAAMKMALQFWRNKGRPSKKRFISLDRGYHGDTAGAMSVGYIKEFFGAYKPILAKVYRLPSPLLYGSGYGNEQELVDACLSRAEALLKTRGDSCAGLVMESGAQIAGGVVVYPQGFQRELAKLCRKYDVLLILDEIATGFGRLGNMVEYLAQGSAPDIACFGKALTGGYFPLAAVAATDSIFRSFLGEYSKGMHFYHGHTFTGHPVGCAAALANLEHYEKTSLIDGIRRSSAHIRKRLEEFRSPLVADIRHKGMLAGIELASEGRPLYQIGKERINYFVMRQSLRRGVYLRPLGNIMMLIPPLAIGRNGLDKIIDTHLEVMSEIENSVLH